MDEIENQTIIETPPVTPANVADLATVAANVAVQEAVEEVREQVTIESRVSAIEEKLNGTHRYLDDISGKLDRVLERTAVTEQVAIEVEETVNAIQTEIVEATLETEAAAMEVADTIAQIDNDIDVDDAVIEEVLDTNDVIDAILPEAKKEKRRLHFL